MREILATSMAVLLLGCLPVLAQQKRRSPSKPKALSQIKDSNTGPVQVQRSAALTIKIASDTVSIFDYLANPQKLTMWFPDQAVLQPQIGGVYHFKWKDAEGVWTGFVTEYIRGNTLGLSWKPPDENDTTNVRFKLSPEGAQTQVELTHSGFRSSESLEKAVKAWVFYLQNLKSVIEDGSDMRGQPRRPSSRSPVRTRRKS